jgi:hypothetical protein
MIDVSTVASIVTTASIVVGIVFTILEIRHLAQTRKTEVIMKIYDRFGTREVVEAINRVGNAKFENIADYSKKYGFTDITQIAELFESVGVLLEQNLMTIIILCTIEKCINSLQTIARAAPETSASFAFKHTV